MKINWRKVAERVLFRNWTLSQKIYLRKPLTNDIKETTADSITWQKTLLPITEIWSKPEDKSSPVIFDDICIIYVGRSHQALAHARQIQHFGKVALDTSLLLDVLQSHLLSLSAVRRWFIAVIRGVCKVNNELVKEDFFC